MTFVTAPTRSRGGPMLRVRDRLGLIVDHFVCAIRGHKWDSDRPSGPLGFERGDLCWRCNKCRPYPKKENT